MTEAAKPMEDHVLVEVTVPAPADAVWAALRDPQKIHQWFGWETEGLKDEIDFIFVSPAKRWRVDSVAVVDERMASDHRPVVAKVASVAKVVPAAVQVPLPTSVRLVIEPLVANNSIVPLLVVRALPAASRSWTVRSGCSTPSTCSVGWSCAVRVTTNS